MTYDINILMLVYNHEKWLPEAFDSLLHQTIQDFNFLIVDDGSSDGSVSVIESYQKRFKNCVFINNKKNKGPIENFHYSFSTVREKFPAAKFFLLASPDDAWSPEYLQKTTSALKDNPKAVICQSGYDMHYLKSGQKAEHRLASLRGRDYWESRNVFYSHGEPQAKTHYNCMLHGMIRFSEFDCIYPPTKKMLGAALVVEISILIAALLRGELVALPEIIYHKKKLGTYEQIYGKNDFTRKSGSFLYRLYALCLCLPWLLKIRKKDKPLTMLISLWLHLVYYYAVLQTYNIFKQSLKR